MCALGFDPREDHVVWLSKDNPGADHKIRSVAAHGGAIWIEVKSTTGFDGTFDWSIAGFERRSAALRASSWTSPVGSTT